MTGSTWHLAPALVTFKAQFNAAFPGRDTRSDGTIGDLRHQHEAGGSDHNPDASGTVCAFDGTYGPYWGVTTADVRQLVLELAASGDPRLNYVIFQGRIWTKARGWHDYPSPPNASPHKEHFHISVFHGAYANDASPWRLPSFGATHVTPTVSVTDLVAAQQSIPVPPADEDDDMPQWFQHGNDVIRQAGNTFIHLTPPAWELDQQFGALATTVDDNRWVAILQGHVQLFPTQTLA